MLKSILRRGPPASTVAPVSDEEDVFQDGEEVTTPRSIPSQSWGTEGSRIAAAHQQSTDFIAERTVRIVNSVTHVLNACVEGFTAQGRLL